MREDGKSMSRKERHGDSVLLNLNYPWVYMQSLSMRLLHTLSKPPLKPQNQPVSSNRKTPRIKEARKLSISGTQSKQ